MLIVLHLVKISGGKYNTCGLFLVSVQSVLRNVVYYIQQNQLQEDQIADQISIKEYTDPFTGSKITKA